MVLYPYYVFKRYFLHTSSLFVSFRGHKHTILGSVSVSFHAHACKRCVPAQTFVPVSSLFTCTSQSLNSKKYESLLVSLYVCRKKLFFCSFSSLLKLRGMWMLMFFRIFLLHTKFVFLLLTNYTFYNEILDISFITPWINHSLCFG